MSKNFDTEKMFYFHKLPTTSASEEELDSRYVKVYERDIIINNTNKISESNKSNKSKHTSERTINLYRFFKNLLGF
jgi:hypothetical protein